MAIADSEEPNLRRRVELRKMTNLRTNLLESTAEILAHPERCKSHFTAQRWESFKHDVRYFRTQENARRWDDAQTDHGYNGTPVWNIVGTILTNLAPASRTQILTFDSIDCLAVIFLSLMIWWAFGWRVLTIALLVFATNFPSRWYWTGGSLLRWDWLFWMGASVCLAKKEHYFSAGMCLAYSTLLRIFPIFMFVAPVLAVGYHLREAPPARAAFLALLHGSRACRRHSRAAQRGDGGRIQRLSRLRCQHHQAPGDAAYQLHGPAHGGELPAVRGRRVSCATTSSSTRSSRWKEARLKSFREARPLYFGIIICYLVLMGLAVRQADPWEAIALSATFIAFGVELTCYYYAFVIVVALLYAKREVVAGWLLAVTAFTQFIGWAPIRKLPNWFPAALKRPRHAHRARRAVHVDGTRHLGRVRDDRLGHDECSPSGLGHGRQEAWA